MFVFPLWLPSDGRAFSISTVTRLVLRCGSDFSTVGTGRSTQPQATDSLTPSKTLEPDNLTLQVTVSLLSERGLDRSCECVCVCVYACVYIHDHLATKSLNGQITGYGMSVDDHREKIT